MSRDCLACNKQRMFNEACSFINEMKWWLLSFLAQNSIKICQNIAWHLISMLPSYFEKPGHEFPTLWSFCIMSSQAWRHHIFTLWLAIIRSCSSQNLKHAHSILMRGLNHSLTMQSCASTQTMHCITMQLKKIFHSDESLLNQMAWYVGIDWFLTDQWCYILNSSQLITLCLLDSC